MSAGPESESRLRGGEPSGHKWPKVSTYVVGVLTALQMACGPSSDCTYKGKKYAPESMWLDACLACSCGVPGSKSQGVMCLPIQSCTDGGEDSSGGGD
jgi:hypothetical protein